MSSELWAHPVTCYRVPFQGGIELSAVLRRSDRIIAWGQHVNTDFTLLKQLKSHQSKLQWRKIKAFISKGQDNLHKNVHLQQDLAFVPD